jgi:hypothetical protein
MKTLYALLLAMSVVQCVCVQANSDVAKLGQVILLDVQALWGGQDLWISTNGNAVCRFVVPPERGESGLRETRYEFKLSKQQQSSLFELIKKHDFFSVRTKDRYGVPDEARPSIFVKSMAKSHAAGKWVNDTHKDFDPIYEYLLKIAESGKKGKQIHVGEIDWHYKPESFPESKSIWDMTRPKVKEE